MTSPRAKKTVELIDSVPLGKEHLAIVACVREKFGTAWYLRYHLVQVDAVTLSAMEEREAAFKSIKQFSPDSVLATVEACDEDDDADDSIDPVYVDAIRKRAHQIAGRSSLQLFDAIELPNSVVALVGERFQNSIDIRLLKTSNATYRALLDGELVLNDVSDVETVGANDEMLWDFEGSLEAFRAETVWLEAKAFIDKKEEAAMLRKALAQQLAATRSAAVNAPERRRL